jgi:menaquinone-dependent protoporphyrinogen oxidase
MNQPTRIHRRRFLKTALGAVVGGTVSCGALGAWAMRQPKTVLISSQCGETKTVGSKVLVAYASRAGSTAEMADEIGKVLCAAGTAADVRPADRVSDVRPYQAVIVGSAVYMGRWLTAATRLVETHQDTLSRIPVATFTACLTMNKDTEENRRQVSAYLDPLWERAPQVHPVAKGLFAGRLDLKRLPVAYRLIVKAMKQPEGDMRDWDKIRAWATDLAPALIGA